MVLIGVNDYGIHIIDGQNRVSMIYVTITHKLTLHVYVYMDIGRY